jgi:hypothetical protein
MKGCFSILIIAAQLLLSATGLLAQENTLRVPVYCSEQTGQMCTYSGSYPGCADEGRVVNIKVTNTTGPVSATLTNASWNGPPCPTYDSHGNRNPETVQPCIMQTVLGSITPTSIPPAGTSVEATVTVQDMGYWTTCYTGDQHPFDTFGTVELEIISLKLELSLDSITLDSGESIWVSGIPYPDNLNVTWSISGSPFQIIGQDGNMVNIWNSGQTAGLPGGFGNLTATLSTGCAVYIQIAQLAVGAAAKKKPCDKDKTKMYDPDKEECFECNKIIHVVKKPTKDYEAGCCCGNLVNKKATSPVHHIASNKQTVKPFTKQFEAIAKAFGLGLDQDWNKVTLNKEYHCSTHPDSYHQWVLQGMQKASAEAMKKKPADQQAEFKRLFKLYVADELAKDYSRLCHPKK